jgi:hypothetical protein
LAVLKGAGLWRVLDLDPTDEQSHRGLMRAYLRNGERRDAIRQFERLRDVLREHVGVGPDPETIALYEQVLGWEGEPPQPEQRIAVLVATGLVHLHRQEFAQAERLARQAMGIAVDAGLSDEAGDAGTLLALSRPGPAAGTRCSGRNSPRRFASHGVERGNLRRPPKAIRARRPHFCARRLTSTPRRAASRTRIVAAPR